jgi:hypothetical protein
MSVIDQIKYVIRTVDYQSKITDFKVYCAHYLTHNLSLAKTILDFSDDVTMLEI